MDQKAFLAITAMLNSFPQQAATDSETLLRTYSAVLRDVSSQAITETAQRFISGDAPDQSRTFAPSVAEFVQEARRWASLIPYRDRPALPAPVRSQPHRFDDEQTRIRMGFKMNVLSAAIGLKAVDRVAEANRRGLEDMIALGQEFGVPVPEELFEQVRRAA
jgi:hypothetical protein